jgi:hypothetical protein
MKLSAGFELSKGKEAAQQRSETFNLRHILIMRNIESRHHEKKSLRPAPNVDVHPFGYITSISQR